MKNLLLLALLGTATAWAHPCAFPTLPKILYSKGDKLIQMWETPNLPVYRTYRLPRSLSLRKFRNTVSRTVSDTSAENLLQRALTFSSAASPEHWNLRAALRMAKRSIRPMQCLEALLLSQQTERGDMVRFPTELIAFVLKSKSTGALRIYYYTINQPGIGGIAEIAGYVKKDLASHPDFFLWKNFHNHNFFLDKKDVGGVPAPSGPDVGAFRGLTEDLGLREALITNGFDTLRLVPGEYRLFRPAK